MGSLHSLELLNYPNPNMNGRAFETCLISLCILFGMADSSHADVEPAGAALFLDFEDENETVRLFHGVQRIKRSYGQALEFTTPQQYAETKSSRGLDGIQSMTVGGWFFPRRSGEQYFFFRLLSTSSRH